MNLITCITSTPQYNALLQLLNVPIEHIISNKYIITIDDICKLIAHTSEEHKDNIEFGKHMYKCYTDYKSHRSIYSFQQSYYKALKDEPYSDNLVALIIIGMCSNLILDEVDSLLKSKGVNTHKVYELMNLDKIEFDYFNYKVNKANVTSDELKKEWLKYISEEQYKIYEEYNS